MARKVKTFFVFVVTMAIAAALVFVPALLAQDVKPVNETVNVNEELPVYSVKTASAGTRTLSAYLEVNGNIVSSGQVAVLSEAQGKLTLVKAALGTRVREGELIAQIDPSSEGKLYMAASVYAPVSGIVCANLPAAGSTVQAGSIITSIAQTDDLQIEALIPEREVSALRVGLTAELRLPAFSGEVFTAKISQVSPMLDPASRTKKIVLTFNKADNRINAGMFAHVKLNTHTYSNVVAVPAESIIQDSGAKYVYVVRDNKVERHEVVTGITVDYFAEIKSGLAEGDVVVIAGQQFLSDGVQVALLN